MAKRIKTTIDGQEVEVIVASDHDAEVERIRTSSVAKYKQSEEFVGIQTNLNKYQTAEKLQNIKQTHFSNFKIKPEYHDDVFKLSGITPDMEDKDIKKTLTEFTSNAKYTHFVDVENDEGTANPPAGVKNKTQAHITGTQTGGGSFWSKFRNNKK